MKFEEALARNNLGNLLEEQYGKWGHFTKVAADIISRATRVRTSEARLAAMVAVTWANESAFNFDPFPQVNCPCRQVWPHDQPTCNQNIFNVWAWDLTPMQMNMMWIHRQVWQGELVTNDTRWVDVFGRSFVGSPEPMLWQGKYEVMVGRPLRFYGSVFDSVLIGSRRLLTQKAKPKFQEGLMIDDVFVEFTDLAELRVVRYTGPGAQPQRLRSWRKYRDLFEEFFHLYTTEDTR
jgi:hypothetical protein